MKILIWIACIFTNAIITTILKQSGILLGAIPTMIFFGVTLWAAGFLCRKWDCRKANKNDTIESVSTKKQESDFPKDNLGKSNSSYMDESKQKEKPSKALRREAKQFSTFQIVVLVIIPILLIAAIWKMIPLDNVVKALVICITCVPIWVVVVTFADHLQYYKKIISTGMAVCITIIVFLVVPVTINIMHSINEKEYLAAYPKDDTIFFKITCDIEQTGGEGSIGNEWMYEHFINGMQFKDGEILSIDAKSLIYITSRFVEMDSISDVGETTSERYRYDQDCLDKPLVINQSVHVEETGGKKYADSTADFDVTYKITRVVPPSVNCWEIYLSSSNSFNKGFCISLIVGQALLIIYVISVLINGNKKKMIAEDAERQKMEQKNSSKCDDVRAHDIDRDDCDQIRFCRKCGEALLNNNSYCDKCGTIIIRE